MVKSQLGSSKVSDFVELVLQRSKFSNITENREQREKKKEWAYREMTFNWIKL